MAYCLQLLVWFLVTVQGFLLALNITPLLRAVQFGIAHASMIEIRGVVNRYVSVYHSIYKNGCAVFRFAVKSGIVQTICSCPTGLFHWH